MTDKQKYEEAVADILKINLACATADGWDDGETFYKDAIERIRDITNKYTKEG